MKIKFLKTHIGLIFASMLLFSSWVQIEEEESDVKLEKLVEMMTGSFSSAEQAASDSSYYDITLHMYPIWESAEEKFLYVEQSVSANPEKPYRQRVYKISELEPGVYISEIYKIENEEKFINKWNEPDFFDKYDQGILLEREGCAVKLERNALGVLEGSTDGKSCKSTLQGATYATSKVTISNEVVESWDQGFDDAGVQVWGATAGPYIFKRINN